MPLKPRFCSQCGAPVDVRHVNGRSRLVCSACDQVFYENPLPVAAALVLNAHREVLLVRRAHEPHQGSWCLPMGFAEIGETIAQAALRELREEAGIEARVLRLIDADSYDSSHYGDLLIVTFELEKTGGRERAGDDASAARYYPIGRHPPLAFSSNEKALRLCATLHLEDWEIQDSFRTLASEQDKALLSDVLVEMIRDHAATIAEQWLLDVRGNATTAAYRGLDADDLRRRAARAISQFGRWLKGDEASAEVRSFYDELGGARRDEDVPVHELVSSLTLLKKHLWTFLQTHEVWQRPIDVYRVLEFNRLMATFFDKATYHAIRAYAALPDEQP